MWASSVSALPAHHNVEKHAMTIKPLLTAPQLRQLLRYDPETGILYWNAREPEWFEDGKRPAEWRARNWNSLFAGKPAGYIAPHGYNLIQLPGRMECAHRIAWTMVHGEWPEFIDHVDGDRANNKLSNLRNVTRGENARNKARPSNNKSGVIGVSWYKGECRWVAEIKHNRKKISLGRYATFEDAVAARKRGEVKYGYHENHGR